MDKAKIIRSIKTAIEELERSLPDLEEAARPVQPDNSIGRLSRMEAINAQAVHLRNFESAKIRLGSLKTALSNIDNEAFGLCVECEEPISEKRILAMPEVRLCIQCAKEMN